MSHIPSFSQSERAKLCLPRIRYEARARSISNSYPYRENFILISNVDDYDASRRKQSISGHRGRRMVANRRRNTARKTTFNYNRGAKGYRLSVFAARARNFK